MEFSSAKRSGGGMVVKGEANLHFIPPEAGILTSVFHLFSD